MEYREYDHYINVLRMKLAVGEYREQVFQSIKDHKWIESAFEEEAKIISIKEGGIAAKEI